MLVYLVNIFLIIVWALVFCTGKKTNLKKFLFVGICFIQCFLISAYRYGIGFDYSMYAAGFFRMTVEGFSSMSYEDWEIGFILLNKFMGLFTAQPSAFIAVTSLLILIGPAYLIARYSINPFLSVFLYVNLYLFYLDMNYVRQALAMSILCFAYQFIKEKKFWRFILVVAIASCFHLTALYMIPVYIVCLLSINSRSLLLYLFGLFFYYILSDGLLNIVLSKVHTEYSGSVFIENGVYFFYALFPLLLALSMVVLSYYVKDKSRALSVLIHMTLMMGFWQIVMTKHSLFERFSYYTMMFVVLAVPEALSAFRKQLETNIKGKYVQRVNGDEKKQKLVAKRAAGRAVMTVSIITAAVMIFAFVYNMVGLIVPANGVHGVLPYQTRSGIYIPSIDSLFKG